MKEKTEAAQLKKQKVESFKSKNFQGVERLKDQEAWVSPKEATARCYDEEDKKINTDNPSETRSDAPGRQDKLCETRTKNY